MCTKVKCWALYKTQLLNTHTKAKQQFIDFGQKPEFHAKTAGLLFRLTKLGFW